MMFKELGLFTDTEIELPGGTVNVPTTTPSLFKHIFQVHDTSAMSISYFSSHVS